MLICSQFDRKRESENCRGEIKGPGMGQTRQRMDRKRAKVGRKEERFGIDKFRGRIMEKQMCRKLPDVWY
jgi:hypothetical protein